MDTTTTRRGHWLAALLILVLGFGIYATRLSILPLQGEETRRGMVALEMQWADDYVTPRQQGEIYTSRAPLGSWLMLAVMPLTGGEINEAAVRLPSALATIAMALVIYFYGLRWMTGFGAFASAVAYLTMIEVMQYGRLGESDAVFGAIVASGLLVWHRGYVDRWPPSVFWTLGYLLAAAGMLTKGLQAPIYFCGVVGIYLLWQRDWKSLFTRGHLVGLLSFVLIVGGYCLLLASRTNIATVQAVFFRMLAEKVTGGEIPFDLAAYMKHLASFPWVYLACVTPWSLYLWHYLRPSFRRQLGPQAEMITFLVIAFVVIFPTVWFSAGARPRYLTPLHPIVAVLTGLVLDRLALAAPGTWDRAYWRIGQFLFAGGAVLAAAGVAWITFTVDELPLAHFAQEPVWLAALVTTALAVTVVLLCAQSQPGALSAGTAMTASAAFLGLMMTGTVLNDRVERANDIAGPVAQLRADLVNQDIVALGLLPHPFRYYWGELIDFHPVPRKYSDVPPGTFFAIQKSDRLTMEQVLRRLPFRSEVVRYINCEPTKKYQPIDWGVIVVRRLPGEPEPRTQNLAAKLMEALERSVKR
jgi:4-amino-4-deoxy-L-arabinose transferase-like glycosyltransferase